METVKLILELLILQSAFEQSIKHLPIQSCEICSKLTIKTPEQLHYDVVLVSLLLTLNRSYTCF